MKKKAREMLSVSVPLGFIQYHLTSQAIRAFPVKSRMCHSVCVCVGAYVSSLSYHSVFIYHRIGMYCVLLLGNLLTRSDFVLNE